jgi:hypothetical protein
MHHVAESVCLLEDPTLTITCIETFDGHVALGTTSGLFLYRIRDNPEPCLDLLKEVLLETIVNLKFLESHLLLLTSNFTLLCSISTESHKLYVYKLTSHELIHIQSLKGITGFALFYPSSSTLAILSKQHILITELNSDLTFPIHMVI